jgi:hypothetical protein
MNKIKNFMVFRLSILWALMTSLMQRLSFDFRVKSVYTRITPKFSCVDLQTLDILY